MDDQCAGPHLDLTVEALSYGRAAVARADGKVYFVEGAAPGDRLRATVTVDHGAYAEANLERLLQAGPARVEPPCPLSGRCGGCPWQHVDYEAQLHAKHRAVVDAFERIAGIRDPPVEEVIRSPQAFGYRNRLKLRFDDGRLGFYSARTHRLVPISDCLVADDRIRASLETVRCFVARLSTRALRVEVASRDQLPGIVVAINAAGRLHRSDAHVVRQLLDSSDSPVTGVTMWGKGWKRSWGDTTRRYAVTDDGLTIDATGSAFGQINGEANRLLVATVIQRARLTGSESVLDLYAGAGNLSIPLARRARGVIAIESDTTAVNAARAVARNHAIAGIEFRAQRVETYLATNLATNLGRRPDLVVANPPRSGLRGAAPALAALRSPHLLYVSCNPATLARDFKALAAEGYKLRSVTPVDLFPHTFHVESVCDAELT